MAQNNGSPAPEQVERTLKKAAAALRDAGVPFLLGGSLACWVRGAAEPPKDLDFMVKPDHAELALDALQAAGMEPERPPEDWLFKAWDGDVLVDVIFRPISMTIDEETFERAEVLNVFSITMPVMSLEEVIATKLLSLNEHYLDFGPLLRVTRSVREQVDWRDVALRTRSSPYARGFLGLLRELDVIGGTEPAGDDGGKRIRVVPASQLP